MDGGRSASVQKLAVTYGPVVALDGIDLTIRPGEVLALMGRNGSGKSTLLHTLSGMRRPTRGLVRVDGKDPQSLRAADLVRHVGLVPQDPGLLLYGESVQGECAAADKGLEPRVGDDPTDSGAGAARHAEPIVTRVTSLRASASPWPWPSSWPRPPSSSSSTSRPGASTTRARTASIGVLRALAEDGHAVVLATHDVELAARVADRVVVLANGQVITDGPARQVVCHSPIFAPQVAKVLAPEEWLTVGEVRRALANAVSA